MGISENLARVRDEIEDALNRCGREAGSVKLVAVSKFHPIEAVREAVDAGQLLFGENRVQEAAEKFLRLLDEERQDVQLHIIGSLQRNKVKRALQVASCIQSVDRAELLLEIEKRAVELEKRIDVLFEVHTGEESKSGYKSESDLFSSIELLASCPHVRVRGLMTMAPFTDDEREVRASFRKLVTIKELCEKRFSHIDLSELSMGMSSDFRIAIEEGSTMVRIGTAIFGQRE